MADCAQNFDQLVGMSASMADVLRMIETCAEQTPPLILLNGEPGTGKSLVARAIHTCGINSTAPFTAFDCNQEGVLRGILSDRWWRLQGTLFIARIDRLPPSLHDSLSRLLRTQLIQRQQVGGHHATGPSQVIISSSCNLQKLVEKQVFSAQLFSLLPTTITLPPLRQRRECIPALVDHFIGYFNNYYKKSVHGVRLTTLKTLQFYDWPDNVRELRHAIETALKNETSSLLTTNYLPAEILRKSRFSEPHNTSAEVAAEFPWMTLPPEGITLEGVEKKLLEQALQRFSGNQSKAARCLGLSRDTMRYRIKKYGLGQQ